MVRAQQAECNRKCMWPWPWLWLCIVVNRPGFGQVFVTCRAAIAHMRNHGGGAIRLLSGTVLEQESPPFLAVLQQTQLKAEKETKLKRCAAPRPHPRFGRTRHAASMRPELLCREGSGAVNLHQAVL